MLGNRSGLYDETRSAHRSIGRCCMRYFVGSLQHKDDVLDVIEKAEFQESWLQGKVAFR